MTLDYVFASCRQCLHCRKDNIPAKVSGHLLFFLLIRLLLLTAEFHVSLIAKLVCPTSQRCYLLALKLPPLIGLESYAEVLPSFKA